MGASFRASRPRILWQVRPTLTPPASGRRSIPAQQGFSLIELLVVIVIIGLLSTVVVMTMADPRGRSTGDADRFARSRSRSARGTSAVVSRPADGALGVADRLLCFERREDGQWRALSEGRLPLRIGQGTRRRASTVSSQLRMVFDSVGRADQVHSISRSRAIHSTSTSG